MATFDRVKMTLPGGKEFVGTGNISVVEQQQPFWLFDGAQTIRTLAEQSDRVANDTSQVYFGTGSRVRSWTIDFTQWEGSTDSWGNANSSDDILVKLNELGQSLANSGIDSRSTATLEYGEYTSSGAHGALNVVPGEITLPAEFGPGESATTFRPSIQWFDAADASGDIHPAP